MPDKAKVIKEWEAVLNRDPLDAPWDLIDDTLALLKEQDNCENCAIAIEDRQPVVRCKDCKHKEESVSPSWEAWCNRLHCGCDLDWYCADGERL